MKLTQLRIQLSIVKINNKRNMKRIILIEVDESCDMARVSLNDECIMEGNDWDFHPGCHGIDEYGDWKGCRQLSHKIRQKLIEDGVQKNDITIRRKTYDWESEQD